MGCNYTTNTDCAKDLKRICSNLGGFACSENNVCKKSLLNATDSDNCCSEKCISKSSLTCEEQKGKLCDISTSYCSGEMIIASNTKTSFLCCSGNCVQVIQEKTCAELNGNICSNDQICGSSLLDAIDSSSCCPSTCITPQSNPCYGITCSANEKCVEGNCILKTCSEQSGYICGANKTCNGSLLSTSDSGNCCSISCTEITTESTDIIGGEISFKDTCIGNHYSLEFTTTSTGTTETNKVNYDVYYDSQKLYSHYINHTPETTMNIIMQQPYEKNLIGHTVKVILDPENLISEINENNNTIERQFTGPLVDLYGEDLKYQDSLKWIIFDLYRAPTIDYCVPFNIDYYVDEQKVGTSPSPFTSAESDSRLNWFYVYELSSGSHELKVVIDSTNNIEESNESNNILITTIEVE